MSTSKAAPMLGDLVSVKGQAVAPTLTVQAAPPAAPAVAQPAAQKVTSTGPVRALTVKLDDNRYKQLKMLGVQESKTTQDLLVQAIDQLLRSK